MSCISSNFSSFFLNSLNDPSEFSKYLSNGELRFSTFEDFQVYNNSNVTPQQQQQYQQQLQQQHQNLGLHHHSQLNGNAGGGVDAMNNGEESNSNLENTLPSVAMQQQTYGSYQQQQQQQQQQHAHPLMHLQQHQQRWTATNTQQPHGQGHVTPQATASHGVNGGGSNSSSVAAAAAAAAAQQSHQQQHFDGSFEFMKYLRHSNDYNDNSHDPRHPHPQHGAASGNASNGPTAIGTKLDTSLNANNNNSLIDLDTPHKQSRSSRKTPAAIMSSSQHLLHHHNGNSNSSSSHPTPMSVDMYDHDSKHTIFDLHHMNSAHSSNSNESSMELSSLTYPNSHLNASNSNTSSEGGGNHGRSDFSMLGVTGNAATGVGSGSNSNAGIKGDDASPAPPKPLATFVIAENFEPHPSHKVEEGIFQHMNKLPNKKKDTLKQLGVRFTGQMTLNDKSIIVDNFIKFCHEYDIQDHRPFLSLNQSGLNKPDQIKFARYLGQGLPTFTLFCIYSNFKNLFCTKRTEIYTKEGYNLPYILDKTKLFLANTAADLKNIINQQSNDDMDFLATAAATVAANPTAGAASVTATNSSNNMGNNMNALNTSLPPPLITTTTSTTAATTQQQHHLPTPQSSGIMNPSMVDYNQPQHTTVKSMLPPNVTAATAAIGASLPPHSHNLHPRPLENLMIYENFDVHESHRIEDGFCTQLSRLPPKKQELLKQFGIQTNQTVTYYEKYILIENFNRFCNEYKMADHRPFLDLSESGLSKSEQLKFLRYLGQGLPNLTLNKIYLVFKDLLGLSRIEKMSIEGYNLDAILKKKKRNLYNRMTAAAVHKECNPDVPTPTIPPALAQPKVPANSNTTTITKVTTIVAAPTSVTSVPAVPSNTSSVLMPLYQQQDSYKT